MAQLDRSSAAVVASAVKSERADWLGRALSQASLLLGLAVAVTGAWHLAAWFARETAWRGLSAITIKTNAALCLFLLGTALALCFPGASNGARLRRGVAALCAAVALLVGGLTLFENLSGIDLGIDQLIAREPAGAIGVNAPNRMGLPGAAGTLFAGLAVLAFVRRPPLVVAGQALGLGVALLGLLSTMGYVYRVQAFYGIVGVTAIAWPTAMALLALGVGLVLLRPTEGLVAPLAAHDAGGQLLRRFLVPTLVVPFVLGWVRLEGERRGWFDASVGTGVVMLFFMVAFSAMMLAAARRVNRWAAALTETQAERERLMATLSDDRERLRQSNERLRSTFDSAAAGIARVDLGSGRFLQANRQFSVMTGYSQEDLQDMTLAGIAHPDQRHEVEENLRRARRGEIADPYFVERHYVRADGRAIDVELHGSIVRDGADRPVQAMVVVIDVTARKQAERELAAAKELAERARAVAEEASLAKDHFLSVLSHELRTPLSPVLTGVSLLRREALSDEGKAVAEIILRNIELESRLIDDLLDLTRITRGKIELRKRPVELCTVLERAIEVCEADVHARGLRLEVDYGPRPCVVEADAARLQQVFWNLLKNAVKFTPAGGAVGLRCRPDGGHVVVEVSDTGIGIDPSALDGIFDAFAQAERSITRQFGGLGLGLTIGRALVELHGGTIEARSEGRDRGATFLVRLPLVSQGVGLASDVGQGDDAVSVAGREIRILLVEDHGDTADLLMTVLQLAGHSVEHAGDVASALEAVERRSGPGGRGGFDLLVSDLGLPDRSGVDLMRELRGRGCPLPGIALSGYGQERDIQRSREAGFAQHLVKPVEPRLVLEAIDRVMAGLRQ